MWLSAPVRFVAFLLVIAGCGSSAPDADMAPTSEATPEPETVVVNSLEELYEHMDFHVLEDGDISESLVAEIPVETRRGGWHLPAYIVGTEVRMSLILDTAAPTVLASRLVPGLDASHMLAEGFETMDTRGNVASRDLHLIRGLLLFPGALFQQVVAAEGWAEQPNNPVSCFNNDGLLGRSLTRFGAWQFDASSSVIRIAQQAEALPLEGYRTFPLAAVENGGMTMAVALEGQELTMVVDTGLAGDIVLSPAVFDALFAEADEYRAVVAVGNGAAQIETIRTVVRSVHLGSSDGIPLRVRIERGQLGHSLVGWHALSALGGIAWQRSTGRLFLKPGEEERIVEPVGRWFSPVWIDGRVSVGVAGSIGAAAGLQEGDVILEVDDLALPTGDFERYCQLLRPMDRRAQRLLIERAGERIEIEM